MSVAMKAGAGRLAGRRALITGGASGIGAAIGARFAAEGAGVVLLDLAAQRERGERLAARLAAGGGQALFAAGDVRVTADLAAAVAMADRELGGLDAVVAAAGIAPPAGLLEGPLAAWQQLLDVNLTGVLATIRAALPALRAAGGGTIVTLASTAAKRPDAGAYSVAKAAVWMLTRCAADDLAHEGIRVNAIGPGFIATPMLERAREQAGEAWFAALPEQIPLGRVGTPDEVANVALFLTSEESAYLTGSILYPDGGWINRFGGG